MHATLRATAVPTYDSAVGVELRLWRVPDATVDRDLQLLVEHCHKQRTALRRQSAGRTTLHESCAAFQIAATARLGELIEISNWQTTSDPLFGGLR
jgi:hypothetical protein